MCAGYFAINHGYGAGLGADVRHLLKSTRDQIKERFKTAQDEHDARVKATQDQLAAHVKQGLSTFTKEVRTFMAHFDQSMVPEEISLLRDGAWVLRIMGRL
jgi:hypothetical protein